MAVDKAISMGIKDGKYISFFFTLIITYAVFFYINGQAVL